MSPFDFQVNRSWKFKQFALDMNNLSIAHYQDWTIGYPGGRPRIASRKTVDNANFPFDFEAVAGGYGNVCDCDDGCFIRGRIMNYGVYNGITRTNAVQVNVPAPTFERSENYEPVVSYRYADVGEDGHYIVAWTRNASVPPAFDSDIYSATLIGGVKTGGLSIVNFQTDNNQTIPSIAGRYGLENNQYLFADADNVPDLKFKGDPNDPGSPGVPGIDPLKQAPNGTLEPGHEHIESEFKGSLFAYPNPFSNELKLEVILNENDKVQHILISDVSGKRVDRLNIQNLKTGRNELFWANDELPSGVYFLELKTNRISEVLRVVKE